MLSLNSIQKEWKMFTNNWDYFRANINETITLSIKTQIEIDCAIKQQTNNIVKAT